MYRKSRNNNKYRKVLGDDNIPKHWHVHHIDFNKENNDINNLISLPELIHNLVHSDFGYMSRNELNNLVKIYNKNC